MTDLLKSQPSGVVLPDPFEMRPFQTVDRGSTNYKAGFNAALRKVRENLNLPPVSAGETWPQQQCPVTGQVTDVDPADMGYSAEEIAEWCKARTALTAQPDHSAQSIEVPEGMRAVAENCAFVMRYIGSMDSDEIDGDSVELRFEDEDGRDTGADASIVDYAEKVADLLDAMLAAAQAPGKEIE